MSEFIKYMNFYARELGMKSTMFDSPHGLSNHKNVSSAVDVCILGQAGMEIPFFAEVVSTQSYRCEKLKRTWTNTNKLLE